MTRLPPVDETTSSGRAWRLLTQTAEGVVADDAFSRGASVAYFTLFSLAPVLLLVIAIAGLIFGRDALYIGQTDVASSFGAAGALIVLLLLWIFYSAQIFLLGAEFTCAWTHVYGARCNDPAIARAAGGRRGKAKSPSR